jgi:predicted alpha/beta hydrolase family esterase
MARNWDAALLDIGPLGHVNSASDLGQWNDGRERLQTFIDHLGSHQGEGTRR